MLKPSLSTHCARPIITYLLLVITVMFLQPQVILILHFLPSQVKATDGRWVDAPPRSDSFVVNACDMLEAWTNGACRSSPHRVKLPTKHRYSVVGFFGPSFDSHISPLPAKNLGNASFSTDFKFPIHYGEYIANKYAASYPTQVFDEMPCEERRIHGQRGTI